MRISCSVSYDRLDLAVLTNEPKDLRTSSINGLFLTVPPIGHRLRAAVLSVTLPLDQADQLFVV